MKTHRTVKLLSLLVAFALIMTSFPIAFAAENKNDTFSVATVNDIHYYPESLTGNKKQVLYSYLTGHNCIYDDLDAILDATLASLEYDVKNNGVKHIVLVGDLTTNGEYEGHKALSEKLLAFEEKTGADIYVTPGNHDINNSRASTFVNDIKEPAKKTSPTEFYEIYKDLGFSDAYSQFTDFTANKHGCLSYSVKTDDGYRLILADAGKFTSDITESGESEQETGGIIDEELLQWVLAEAESAKENGEIPLLFTHWNMSGVSYMHEFVLQGFVIDNGYMLQEILADAGINYCFSGHQHLSDVDITYSDSGNPMYSVITPTVTQFPFAYRVTDFTKASDGALDVTFHQRACDEYEGVRALSGNGTYPSPYRETGFYKQFGGHSDATDYLFGAIKNTLDKYINSIRAQGSIVAFIEEEMNIDIEKYIDTFLMGGIYLDGKKVISGENVMSFLDDLDTQIMTQYIYNKEETYGIIKNALDELLAIQLSDYPCDKFITSYGFGDEEKGGTLGDALLSVLAYMYMGNEDISDDPFMQDVIEFSGTREFLDLLIENIREIVVNDILIDNILSNIELNFDTLFLGKAATVGDYIQMIYTIILSLIDSGLFEAKDAYEIAEAIAKIESNFNDISIKRIIEAVLGTGLVPYGTTIDELIDFLLDEFLPEDSRDAVVYQAKIVIGGTVSDETKDWDVTYRNEGAVKVIPTKEDMQLPVNVTISMTEDNTSSFTVSWFTKYSVTGTDIEVVKEGEAFTGKPSTENVTAITQNEEYSAPGYDAGSISILPYTRNIVKHTVTVGGLDADTEYKFRIGDFEKNFVSEGSIKTAPEKDGSFTFIHLSDTTGTVPSHYTAFGNTLKAAEGLYPDSSFIVHTGNLVSNPENDDQWSYALAEGEDTFTSKPFVYASGTNDDEGNYEAAKYFSVNHAPSQLSDSGVYYSYDYANAHFAVINTNDRLSAGSLSKEQTSWLRSDLENSSAKWNILIMHESIYGSVTDSSLHSQIVNIMNEYGIDLVLQGSDTAYVRTAPLNKDNKAEYGIKTTEINGVKYDTYYDTVGSVAIISGCTSHRISEAEGEYAFAEKTVREALPMFTAVTISDNILSVNAYTVNGTEAMETDRFAIEKAGISRLVGDVDNDGKVSAADARLALRASVQLENLNRQDYAVADVNMDGNVSADDARTILRVSVGLEAFKEKYIFV